MKPSSISYVIGNGRVAALAGGPLSLADLGARKTRRVSHIEFSDRRQKWQVKTIRGKLLSEFADYDTALSWERDWFNANPDLLT